MKLENLKLLKEDMIKNGWTICSFIFTYKRIEYIVLVKRFVGTEKRVNKYALVKLHFIKSKNLDDDLQVEANSSGILIDARQLREYFEIEYNENLGDILQEFIERLGTFEFNADKTKLLRPSLYTYFSNDESISFCYYSDERMENDDETILKNFSSR